MRSYWLGPSPVQDTDIDVGRTPYDDGGRDCSDTAVTKDHRHLPKLGE